jgi:hypothetical protein
MFSNCHRMKDQLCFACLILQHNIRNKASDAYNDVSDAECVETHV